MRNSLIASRVFNTPLMIHPAKLDAIASFMRARMFEDDYTEPLPKERSIYAEQNMHIIDGIAFIGMQGVLVNRKGQMQGVSDELTSYHRIRENLQSALNQGATHVILDVDSPGGEAIGAYECAEFIYGLRGNLPITACISGMCCSAAYFLASAATTITIAPTSFAGHVGVRYRRWDFTQAIANQAVNYEDFYAGDFKLEGDPTVSMTDQERAHIKSEIDMHYQLFAQSVARYRGLTPEQVIETNAMTYYGQDAVAIGFADRVIEAHDAVQQIYQQRKKPMVFGISQAQQDLPSESTIDTKALKEAVQSERARIKGILSNEAATGREALAQHIAFNTDLTPDMALGMLASAPLAQPALTRETGMLEKLMQQAGAPEISSIGSKPKTAEQLEDEQFEAEFKAKGRM